MRACFWVIVAWSVCAIAFWLWQPATAGFIWIGSAIGLRLLVWSDRKYYRRPQQ